MYKCGECGRAYASRTSLARHSLNHQRKKQHMCDTCGVVFYRRDLLSRHLKLHSRAPDRQRACPASGPPSSDSTAAQAEPRKRCHTACNRCRELRVKCCGVNPCAACSKAGRPCEYDNLSRRLSHLPSQFQATDMASDPSRTETQSAHGDSSPSSRWDDHGSTEQLGSSQPAGQACGRPHAPVAQQSSLGPSADGPMPDTPDSLIIPTVPSQNDQPQESGGAADHHAIGHIEASDQTHMHLDFHPPSPVVFWPWLHENLYLPTYDDLIFDTAETARTIDASQNLFQEYDGEDSTRNGEAASGTHSSNAQGQAFSITFHSTSSQPYQWDAPSGPSAFVPPAAERTEPLSMSRPESRSASDGHPDRMRVVNELIEFASTRGRDRARSSPVCSDVWRVMSARVSEAFEIPSDSVPASVPVLDHFVSLFLKHFDPLWPLFTPQSLDVHQLHPLLYLVLTTIGAMYCDHKSSTYGNMMHSSVRACLVTPLELDNADGDLMWLAQARVTTQMAALYFGQPKAFSYAQHIGALLVAQVRRMDLFSDAHERAESRRSAASDDERFASWVRLEARRRLAFAIFRADSYTSILLDTRPMVYLGEINLAFPSCETVWRSHKLPARLGLQLVENDQTPGRDLLGSDIYRIALDKDEALPPLDPIGLELLALGLVWPVWEFSRDRERFLRHPDDYGRDSTSLPATDGREAATSGIPSPGPSSVRGECPQTQQRPLRTTGMSSTPTLSEVERLESTPRQMADHHADRGRLLRAWDKWSSSVPWVKSLARTDFDRSSLIGSLLAYHLASIHLGCPISSLHQIQYGLADGGRGPSPDDLLLAYRWAGSPHGRASAERAVSICALIAKQATAQRNTDVNFNLLAFIALHRAIVLLWAFAGAGGPAATSESGAAPLTLRLGGLRDIPINRANNSAIILELVGLYNTISPGRWSPFAEAAKPLSSTPFPDLQGVYA